MAEARMARATRLTGSAALLLATGCYAGLGATAGDPGETDGSQDASTTADADTQSADESTGGNAGPGPGDADAVTAQPLTRLSSAEYVSTMRDLLGEHVFAHVELDVLALPADARVHRGIAPADMGHLDTYAAVARKAAQALIDEPSRFADVGAPCLAELSPHEACVRQAVADFGLRAYRRPLTAAEVDELYAFYREPDDHEEGALRVVMRLLMAPQLLFHLELEGKEEQGLLRLDDYAVASRLSYRLLGTMPPPELLAAAAAGKLRTAADLEAIVPTLLDDPRARAHAVEMFAAWMEVEAFPILPAGDPVLGAADPVALRDAAIDEFHTFVRTLVFEDETSFAGLMTSPKSFPSDPSLADLYGVPAWSGDGPAPEGDHLGVLQRVAAIAFGSHQTAPILRGVFLLRDVLCSDIPSPDADVVNSRLDELDELDPAEATSRQIIDVITGAEPCSSCHAQINPLAFAMGDLGPLGRKRTTEVIYDADGVVLAEHPVDATVELALPGEGVRTVSGSDELVAAIAELPAAQRCFADRVFAHTRLRPVSAEDKAAVSDLEALVAGDDVPLVETLIANVASEQTLWRALEE